MPPEPEREAIAEQARLLASLQGRLSSGGDSSNGMDEEDDGEQPPRLAGLLLFASHA